MWSFVFAVEAARSGGSRRRAVVSLVAIAAGLSFVLAGRKSPTVIATHAYCLNWSYAGSVAAGSGQLTVAVGHDVDA